MKSRMLCLSIALMLASPQYLFAAQPAEGDVRDSLNPAVLLPMGGQAIAGMMPEPKGLLAPEMPADEQRITLDLKGVDVLDVLKILGERANLNIVAGKNVRGTVTLYLKDVPIRDALNTIVSALDLAYVDDGSILNVMSNQALEGTFGLTQENGFTTRVIQTRFISPDEALKIVEQIKTPRGKITVDVRTSSLVITDRVQNIEEIEKTLSELDQPLVTRVFRIQYAEVGVLASEIQHYITPDVGIMNIDERTNRISVTDRQEKIEQIDGVVDAFDTPPKQVLIEAKLVEVGLFDAHRSGIDWQYVRDSIGAFDNVELKPTFNLASPNSALGGGALSTFTLGGVTGMQTVLSLLQNVGKTDTLSTPRLTVLNNEEAKLVDATKQPYVQQTVVQSLNTAQTSDNVQFVDVGVSLTVVPSIADDGRLVLRLKPEVSSQTGTLEIQSVSEGSDTTFTRSAIPIIASQSLETTVLVRSGETLVVGGLIKDKKTKVRGKLPFVSELPGFGRLFQSESIDYQKTELVIFLTPHILNDDAGRIVYPANPVPSDQAPPAARIDGILIGDPGTVLQPIPEPVKNRRLPYWNSEASSSDDVLSAEEREELNLEYQAVLATVVKNKLAAGGLTEKEETGAKLFLHLRRDGTLLNVSFLDPGKLESWSNQDGILKVLKEGGNYPEFPWGMNKAEESFYIKL